jgi:hypothetical protein
LFLHVSLTGFKKKLCSERVQEFVDGTIGEVFVDSTTNELNQLFAMQACGSYLVTPSRVDRLITNHLPMTKHLFISSSHVLHFA